MKERKKEKKKTIEFLFEVPWKIGLGDFNEDRAGARFKLATFDGISVN